MRFPWSLRWAAVVVLIATSCPQPAVSQTELTRKATVKIAPEYPELARRMKLRGTVKIMVTVMPNGNLKDTKVMGGNPILVNAAMEALKKWRFEPAQAESSGTVEFSFEPSE